MDLRQRTGTEGNGGKRRRERQIAPKARQLMSFCFTEFVPSSSHMENESSSPCRF